MARILLAIMILFMAIGPIAHGYLAFKFNALTTLSPEEETHDEKPQNKGKQDFKDQFFYSFASNQQSRADQAKAHQLHEPLNLPEGYAGTLLMPPDVN